MITLEGLIEGNVAIDEIREGLKYGENGKPRFTFSVAVSNDYWDKNEQKRVEKPPTWYKFTIWNEDQIKRFGWVKKGMHVLVRFSGLETEEWTSKSTGKQGFSIKPKYVNDVWEIIFHKKVNLDGDIAPFDDDNVSLA